MKKRPKEFAVIGLGRFGCSVASTLADLGQEVLAIDKDPGPVQDALEYASEARELDATSAKALDEVGIEDFNVVVVCIEDVQTSLLISLLCIEKGVPQVITKAQSAIQGDLLSRIGVSECVFPERSAGRQLAERLATNGILQSMTLGADYGTASLNAPMEWVGRTLKDLDLRNKYGLNVIAVKRVDGTVNISPQADDVIMEGDRIHVIGTAEDIEKMKDRLLKHGAL